MAVENLFENEQYKLMPVKTDENLICDGVQIHSHHFLLLPCPVQLSRNSRKWRSDSERQGSERKKNGEAGTFLVLFPKGHFGIGTRKRHTLHCHLPTNESLLLCHGYLVLALYTNPVGNSSTSITYDYGDLMPKMGYKLSNHIMQLNK